MDRTKIRRVVRSVAVCTAAAVVIAATVSLGIFWMLGVLAGCAVLTGAAVWGLKRWSDGKVYYTATRPMQVRAERVDPPPGAPPGPLRKVIPGKAE